MLPPVAALSDTALSQFNQSQYLPASSRVQIGNPRGDSVVGPLTSPAAFASDRRDVLSLSGQLQLAQGLSSVAEAVGGVLKLARHEGETLTDYADRLAETIAALPPAERVALQRVLMQLIKGVTLRLLVDILKNPFGPEATRLSLQLETEAATERDPVTKLVVTSYRQNDGSGAAIGPQARPVFTTNGAALLAAAAQKVPGQPTAQAQAQVSAQALPQASALATASEAGGLVPTDLSESTVATVSPDADVAQQTFAQKGGQPGALAVVLENGQTTYHPDAAAAPGALPAAQDKAEDVSGPIGARIAQALTDKGQESLEFVDLPETGLTSSERADAAKTPATDLAPPVRDEVTYDGPALARQGSQRAQSFTSAAALRLQQVSVELASAGAARMAANAALVSPTGKPVIAVVETVAGTSDRYAAIFAGDSFGDEFSFGPKAQGQVSSASVSPLPAIASAGTAQPAALTANAVSPAEAAVQAAQNEGANAGAVVDEMQTASTPASAQAEAADAAMMSEPSSQVAAQADDIPVDPASHRQDGLSFAPTRTASATAFVPAFVPYPVSALATQGSGDLVRPVEAVDEDDRSGRRRHGRGQGGEDEAGSEEQSDDEFSASDAAQAETEMSADTETGKTAPTAHLAADRHGEAQDFYQRLAAW